MQREAGGTPDASQVPGGDEALATNAHKQFARLDVACLEYDLVRGWCL